MQQAEDDRAAAQCSPLHAAAAAAAAAAVHFSNLYRLSVHCLCIRHAAQTVSRWAASLLLIGTLLTVGSSTWIAHNTQHVIMFPALHTQLHASAEHASTEHASANAGVQVEF